MRSALDTAVFKIIFCVSKAGGALKVNKHLKQNHTHCHHRGKNSFGDQAQIVREQEK